MVLHNAQKQIAIDTHRFRVVNCGRRFGKTTLAIEEIKGKALSRPSRICYIAPTYQQARDIAWNILKTELKPIANNINESRLEMEVMTKDNESSFIYLRGWESIETLRGQQYDFLVIDEIAMMRSFWLNWQEVIRPTLTDTRGEAMFISTPKGFNHFYDLFNMQKEDKDYKSFHFTSYDNHHLPVDELDKAKVELTEDRFAQEYMADFRKTEGLVYKCFNRAQHVYADHLRIPEFVETFLAIDFGFTNPACILKVGKDRDRNYWILEEFYKPKYTTAQLIEVAKNMGANIVYADPAEPDRLEEFTRGGMYMRDVNKGKGSIASGIVKLTELFKQQRIKIHNSCENLILELETYSYPDKKPGKNENEDPIKEHDHAVDALRYALVTNEPQSVIRQNFGDNNKKSFI